MEVPLSREIKETLARLKIKCLPFDAMKGAIEARETLPPNVPGGAKITANTFWDLSPRFQFDALFQEIPNVEKQLAHSIALASIYSPFVRYELPFRADSGHSLFWYHADYGTRLASSGWDRLALLLDLCFKLGLAEKCNLRRALGTLANKHSDVVDHEAFKWLKNFRDKEFDELDGHNGVGARHESSHLLSAAGRDFWETLEDMTKHPGKVQASGAERVVAHIEFLKRHFALYQEGILQVVALLANKFPAPVRLVGGSETSA